MTGTRQRLTGRIQVSLPPDEAFRLFTPRGEQEWAAGWEPRFPAPAPDDTEPGTVFETDAHGQHTIWLVLDRHWGKRICYARVTPGGLAGTVTVAVNAASRHTEVDVTYDLTELTGATGPPATNSASSPAPTPPTSSPGRTPSQRGYAGSLRHTMTDRWVITMSGSDQGIARV